MLTITKTRVNKDQGTRTPNTDPINTQSGSLGELFSDLQQKHGRCTGKVRVDTKAEEGVPIGWVFQRRRAYQDSSDTFLEETWVTLLDHTEEQGFVRQDLRKVA